MSIRECKGDKGRDLHPGSLLTFTSAFPDLFVAHAVTATFPAPPCPHGEIGGGRERPPLFPARCGRGGVAQFTSAPHPLGGSLPSNISLAGRPRSAAENAADQPAGRASGSTGRNFERGSKGSVASPHQPQCITLDRLAHDTQTCREPPVASEYAVGSNEDSAQDDGDVADRTSCHRIHTFTIVRYRCHQTSADTCGWGLSDRLIRYACARTRETTQVTARFSN